MASTRQETSRWVSTGQDGIPTRAPYVIAAPSSLFLLLLQDAKGRGFESRCGQGSYYVQPLCSTTRAALMIVRVEASVGVHGIRLGEEDWTKARRRFFHHQEAKAQHESN